MRLEDDFDAAEPPATMSPPQQALWWLGKGGWRTGAAWEKAHLICQSAEGQRDFDLVHAVAHLVEGDLGNADYWFRRAGIARESGDPRAEWARAVDLVG